MITRARTWEEKVALVPRNGTILAPLRLNLHCGEAWMPGRIINIDSRLFVPPEGIVYLRANPVDLRDMFRNASCAAIWVRDLSRCVPRASVQSALAEWSRLLIPGGTLHLSDSERTGDRLSGMLAGLLAQYDLVPIVGPHVDAGSLVLDARKDGAP